MTWLFAVLLGIRHTNVRIAEMCIPSLCLGKTVTVVTLQETPAHYFSFFFFFFCFFFLREGEYLLYRLHKLQKWIYCLE